MPARSEGGREAKRFGRYELLTELGRGGMAELHLARMSGIGGFEKLVALKLMLPHLSQNKQFCDLFINEGRIAARISHPNVCQVFEIGEEDGQLFLVMEYLEGVTWEELLRQLPADPITVLRIVTGVLAQACEGLHYAHELRDGNGEPMGVVHRDISPQNLFITVDGVCKVLDFGVAKVLNSNTHTRTGVLKGKLPYMSPEQIRGEEIDARSDVFATGVVLWEALANRPLFLREVEFQIWKAVLEDKIDPVSAWEPAYGREVDAVILKALDRDRDRRHTSMKELADDLRRLGDEWGGAFTPGDISELVRRRCADKLAARNAELAAIEMIRERPASSPAAITAPGETADDGIALRSDSVVIDRKKKRRSWPLALGAVAAIAGGMGLNFALRDKPAPAASEPAPVVAAAPEATPAPPPDPTPAPAPSPTPAPTPAPPEEASTPVAPVASAPDPRPAATRTKSSRVPAKRRVASSQPREPAAAPPPAAVSTQPGMLSVNAKPSGRVYVDGVFVDETPLFRHKLSAGKHEVRIVPTEGAPKRIPVQIKPGELLNLGTVAL